MKIRHLYRLCLIISIQSAINDCSLPENIDPARWRMHVEFPVIDQTVSVTDLFRYSPVSEASFDSSVAGDTIVYTKKDSVTYHFEHTFGSKNTYEFNKKIGSFTIEHVPPVTLFFQPAKSLPKYASSSMSLPADVTISMSQKGYHLDGIQMIGFDETSPDLEIEVVNHSTEAQLKNIVIALLDGEDFSCVEYCAELLPQTSDTLHIALAGKRLTSPIAVAVCMAVPKGTRVYRHDCLELSFSFNGQVVSEAVIRDNYINYDIELLKNVVIADSVRIRKIETAMTTLGCEIACPAKLKMQFLGFIDANGPKEPDDGIGYPDELFFSDTIFRLPHTARYNINMPFKTVCIYPGWDSLSAKSVLGLRFVLKVLHENRYIRLNKNDELSLKLHPLRFPVKKVDGVFYRKFGYATKAAVKTGLKTLDPAANALQKNLYFRNVRLNVSLNPGLPSESILDSLYISAVMRSPHHDGKDVIVRKILHNVHADSRYNSKMEFTGLFNCWPDTFTFKIRLDIPGGTDFVIQNDYVDEGQNTSVLQFNPSITWNAEVPLCWDVKDKTVIEVKKSRISLTDDRLDLIKKLENPQINILIDVENQTSISCRIFALGCAASAMSVLETFPDSLVGTEAMMSTLSDTLFTLTGNEGIFVPVRNRTGHSELIVNERAIKALLSGENCLFRWFVELLEADADATRVKDYCRITAVGVVEGIANSDTLCTLN